LEKCTQALVIKSMPDGPVKFTKIVLKKSEEQNLIFRAEEELLEIVATDYLVEKI